MGEEGKKETEKIGKTTEGLGAHPDVRRWQFGPAFGGSQSEKNTIELKLSEMRRKFPTTRP
jgi:hypothetical protein